MNKIQNNHEFPKLIKEKGINFNSENVQAVSDMRMNEMHEKSSRNEQCEMNETSSRNEKCNMNMESSADECSRWQG